MDRWQVCIVNSMELVLENGGKDVGPEGCRGDPSLRRLGFISKDFFSKGIKDLPCIHLAVV